MVRVAICAPLPVMLTGLVLPNVKVGRLVAPVGEAVIDAESETAPAKPPTGVTVTATVFPVVAPAWSESCGASMVKPGGGVTVTAAIPYAPKYSAVEAESGM
jgi:hypothetical protein